MIAPLAAATTLGALLAALWLAAAAALGRFRWSRSLGALAALQLALVVDAVADVAGLVGGHRPGEPGVHLAYLLTSLCVLPTAATLTTRDDGRWSAALLTGALVVTAVVVVRAQTTWRPA